MREVLSLSYEFIISLVVLVGGGFMVYSEHGVEVGVSSVTAVITFWFARRQQEQNQAQNQKQIELMQQVQQPTQLVQEPDKGVNP